MPPNPSQTAFTAEYNVGTALRNATAGTPTGNSVGVTDPVGTSAPQATSGQFTPAGNLANGATGYKVGTGYWLGTDKGIAKLFIGSATKYVTWDGSTLNVVGGVSISELNIPDITTANSFHVDGNGNAWWGTNTATGYATAPAKILNTGAATFSNITITGGAVATQVLNTSVMRATSNIAFTSTSNTVISWSSGAIVTAAAVTFTISSGNTGTMAALTYIYLDTAISTTVLQITTTYSTAVGDGKILVATAQNETAGGAYCIPYLGGAPLLNGAAQINAFSIQAGQISVASLSAISANLGTITTGTITFDTAGYLRGGQTDYQTGVGFFLGYSGGAYKFSVGDPTGDYLTWDGSQLNVTSSRISRQFIADEAINAGDAVAVSDGTLILTNYTSTATTSTIMTFGLSNGDSQQMAIKIAVGSIAFPFKTITITLAKNSTPTDNVVVALQADSGGLPSGSDIDTASVAGSSLTSSPVDYLFTLSASHTLTASTNYWIVVRRSGAINNSLYYQIHGDATNGFAAANNGSSWSAFANFRPRVVLKVTSTAGHILQTSANTSGRYPNFIGFADSAIVLGSAGTVAISGVVLSLSGLSPGSQYYLSNTLGLVSTSAGSNTRKVGIATSATSLLITNIW